jgi:hypothetical protein
VTDVFADRYGDGALERLLELFRQPCVTFAQIAADFGVSRERVRQWHLELLPDAPHGLERRRLCGASSQRRRLLSDALFRAFYRHARPQFTPDRLQLVRAGAGFRKRILRLDSAVVALKAARVVSAAARADGVRSYVVAGYRGSAAFVYCWLSDADFLFMPASALPAGGTTFVDTRASKYHAFKNTFAALAVVSPQTEPARAAQDAL